MVNDFIFLILEHKSITQVIQEWLIVDNAFNIDSTAEMSDFIII